MRVQGIVLGLCFSLLLLPIAHSENGLGTLYSPVGFFSGFYWLTSYTGPFSGSGGPGGNHYSRNNVKLSGSGTNTKLHLRVTNETGAWTNAQIHMCDEAAGCSATTWLAGMRSQKKMLFGSFSWMIENISGGFDDNLVLGLYSYRGNALSCEDKADQTKVEAVKGKCGCPSPCDGNTDTSNEIDIQWANLDGTSPAVWFRMWPQIPIGYGNNFQRKVPETEGELNGLDGFGTPRCHHFDWRPDNVTFSTWILQGDLQTMAQQGCKQVPKTCMPPTCTQIIYNGEKTMIPQLPGVPSMNLWVKPGKHAPADGKPHEVVIGQFNFVGHTAPAPSPAPSPAPAPAPQPWNPKCSHFIVQHHVDTVLSAASNNNTHNSLAEALGSARSGETICYKAHSLQALVYDDCANVNITKSVTISVDSGVFVPEGQAGSVVIDCKSTSRYVNVLGERENPAEGVAVSIQFLNLRNGWALQGGLIAAQHAQLTIEDCSFTSSNSTCEVQQNRTTGLFSAASCYPPQLEALNAKKLPQVAGGGAIFVQHSQIKISGSLFADNNANSYGGAILSINSTSSNFTRNEFVTNSARYVAGAVGIVYWGDASDRWHVFEHNTFHSNKGGGIGAGGIGILYFGAQHHRNTHVIAACKFVNCTGGNDQIYEGGVGGGGGSGGAAILYVGSQMHTLQTSSKLLPGDEFDAHASADEGSTNRLRETTTLRTQASVLITGNRHEVRDSRFENCSGGNRNSYFSSVVSSCRDDVRGDIQSEATGGGGGAGGFAIIYAPSAALPEVIPPKKPCPSSVKKPSHCVINSPRNINLCCSIGVPGIKTEADMNKFCGGPPTGHPFYCQGDTASEDIYSHDIKYNISDMKHTEAVTINIHSNSHIVQNTNFSTCQGGDENVYRANSSTYSDGSGVAKSSAVTSGGGGSGGLTFILAPAGSSTSGGLDSTTDVCVSQNTFNITQVYSVACHGGRYNEFTSSSNAVALSSSKLLESSSRSSVSGGGGAGGLSIIFAPAASGYRSRSSSDFNSVIISQLHAESCMGGQGNSFSSSSIGVNNGDGDTVGNCATSGGGGAGSLAVIHSPASSASAISGSSSDRNVYFFAHITIISSNGGQANMYTSKSNCTTDPVKFQTDDSVNASSSAVVAGGGGAGGLTVMHTPASSTECVDSLTSSSSGSSSSGTLLHLADIDLQNCSGGQHNHYGSISNSDNGLRDGDDSTNSRSSYSSSAASGGGGAGGVALLFLPASAAGRSTISNSNSSENSYFVRRISAQSCIGGDYNWFNSSSHSRGGSHLTFTTVASGSCSSCSGGGGAGAITLIHGPASTASRSVGSSTSRSVANTANFSEVHVTASNGGSSNVFASRSGDELLTFSDSHISSCSSSVSGGGGAGGLSIIFAPAAASVYYYGGSADSVTTANSSNNEFLVQHVVVQSSNGGQRNSFAAISANPGSFGSSSASGGGGAGGVALLVVPSVACMQGHAVCRGSECVFILRDISMMQSQGGQWNRFYSRGASSYSSSSSASGGGGAGGAAIVVSPSVSNSYGDALTESTSNSNTFEMTQVNVTLCRGGVGNKFNSTGGGYTYSTSSSTASGGGGAGGVTLIVSPAASTSTPYLILDWEKTASAPVRPSACNSSSDFNSVIISQLHAESCMGGQGNNFSSSSIATFVSSYSGYSSSAASGGGGAGGVALLFLPAASSVNSDAEPTNYSKATPHMPTSVTASSDFCTTQFVGVEIHASEGGSGNFHQTLGYSAIQRQNFHNYGHGQGSNIGDVTCSSSAATSGGGGAGGVAVVQSPSSSLSSASSSDRSSSSSSNNTQKSHQVRIEQCTGGNNNYYDVVEHAEPGASSFTCANSCGGAGGMGFFYAPCSTGFGDAVAVCADNKQNPKCGKLSTFCDGACTSQNRHDLAFTTISRTGLRTGSGPPTHLDMPAAAASGLAVVFSPRVSFPSVLCNALGNQIQTLHSHIESCYVDHAKTVSAIAAAVASVVIVVAPSGPKNQFSVAELNSVVLNGTLTRNCSANFAGPSNFGSPGYKEAAGSLIVFPKCPTVVRSNVFQSFGELYDTNTGVDLWVANLFTVIVEGANFSSSGAGHGRALVIEGDGVGSDSGGTAVRLADTHFQGSVTDLFSNRAVQATKSTNFLISPFALNVVNGEVDKQNEKVAAPAGILAATLKFDDESQAGCLGEYYLQLAPSSAQYSCIPCKCGENQFVTHCPSKGRVPPHGKGALYQLLSGIPKCSSCPFGGLCNDSILYASAGYWSSPDALSMLDATVSGRTSTSTSTSVMASSAVSTRSSPFLVCPPGFCCHNSSGCMLTDQCQGHRNSRIPLCGACSPGHSHAIDSFNCVENASCSSIAEFTAQQLVYFLAYIMYALHQAAYAPLVSKLPEFLRPAPRSECNCVSVLVFFYQLCMQAVPTESNAFVGQFTSSIGQLIGAMHFPISADGTCVAKGMTGLHKLLWDFFAPFVMFGLLAIVAAPNSRFCSAEHTSDRRYITSSLLRPFVDQSEVAGGFDSESEESNGDFDSDEEEIYQTFLSLSNRYGIYRAFACLILLCISSLASSTLRLLNCVQLPQQGPVVLFYSGDTECRGSWQWPLWLFLAVLVLFPLIPVLVWAIRRLPASSSLSVWANRFSIPKHYHFIYGMGQYFTEPFKSDYWFWAALAALQRFSTVACTALGGNANGPVGVVLLSISFLVFHLLAMPYRDWASNAVQLVAYICLSFVSVLGLARSMMSQVGFDPTGTPIERFVSRIDWAMLILLFPPLLTYMFLAWWRVYYGPEINRSNEPTGIENISRELNQLKAQNKMLMVENEQLRCLRPEISSEHAQNKQAT